MKYIRLLRRSVQDAAKLGTMPLPLPLPVDRLSVIFPLTPIRHTSFKLV